VDGVVAKGGLFGGLLGMLKGKWGWLHNGRKPVQAAMLRRGFFG
jgi:hypothetical protein